MVFEGMKRKVLLLALLAAMLVTVAYGFSHKGAARSVAEASMMPDAPARLQVYVFNVERGQSVLIISPVGKAALIDAGPTEAGSRVVSELRRLGIRNLELVVATQAGADYIGGLRRVASSSDIAIRNLIDSAQPWESDAHKQLLAAAQSANVPVTAARRGQFFDLGGGARLDISNPAGDGTWMEPQAGASRESANGVVARLVYREFIMLVMGGAGAATAEKIVDARQNIWAPFLVIGDGGSRNALSERMLSIVQPRFAIISGAPQGGPAPETIEQLKAVKAEIYRTDTGGTISITSDGRKHEIQKTELRGQR